MNEHVHPSLWHWQNHRKWIELPSTGPSVTKEDPKTSRTRGGGSLWFRSKGGWYSKRNQCIQRTTRTNVPGLLHGDRARVIRYWGRVFPGCLHWTQRNWLPQRTGWRWLLLFWYKAEYASQGAYQGRHSTSPLTMTTLMNTWCPKKTSLMICSEICQWMTFLEWMSILIHTHLLYEHWWLSKMLPRSNHISDGIH